MCISLKLWFWYRSNMEAILWLAWQRRTADYGRDWLDCPPALPLCSEHTSAANGNFSIRRDTSTSGWSGKSMNDVTEWIHSTGTPQVQYNFFITLRLKKTRQVGVWRKQIPKKKIRYTFCCSTGRTRSR